MTYIPLQTAANGSITTTQTGPVTSYGDQQALTLKPIVSTNYTYGISESQIESVTQNSGTITASNSVLACSTAASAKSFSCISSHRVISPLDGIGILGRFSGFFSAGATGNVQRMGIGNSLSGAYFGYNDTTFGITYEPGGVLAVQTVTITTGFTAASTVTITLNDGATARTFAFTSTIGGINPTAAQIASLNYMTGAGTTLGTTAYPGWIASANGATVTFICALAQPNNTLSIAFGASGGVASAPVSVITGVVPTASESVFVAQTSWNIDKMDGVGSSGMTLDPQKGNIYSIGLSNTGYSSILYSIYNPSTNLMVPVHRIVYSNTFTVVDFKVPSLYCLASSRNTTNTTSVSVTSASMAGFLQGHAFENYGSPIRRYDFKAASTTTSQSMAFSISSKVTKNNQLCTAGIRLLTLITSCDAGRFVPVTGTIGTIGTVSGVYTQVFPAATTQWAELDSSSSALIGTNTFITDITGGTPILDITTAPASNNIVDLRPYSIILSKNQCFTISIDPVVTYAINLFSVSVIWEELR